MREDFDSFRFGKAACRKCGHHPIQHLTEQELLTGVPGTCAGKHDGGVPCTCVGYEASPDDEPVMVFDGPKGTP